MPHHPQSLNRLSGPSAVYYNTIFFSAFLLSAFFPLFLVCAPNVDDEAIIMTGDNGINKDYGSLFLLYSKFLSALSSLPPFLLFHTIPMIIILPVVVKVGRICSDDTHI